MKQLFSFCLLCLFLVSCGNADEIVQDQKQDFFIQTQKYEDFSQELSLEKSGKVSSSQDIQLTSQASGRVAALKVKAGDSVSAGQTIALLDDTIGSYSLNLQRAANGVERAKINYESTQLQLQKQVFDSEAQLATLQRNLETLEKDAQQSVKQATDSLQNSQYETLDSRSALQLEQLDNNIEKTKLDIETKKIADRETLAGFGSNLPKDFNALVILLDDIIQFSDELLGVTEKNKYKNDDYDQFLGAKDTTQKRESERALESLIAYRSSAEFTDMQASLNAGNFSEEAMIASIDFIIAGYDDSKELLNQLETTLNNSIESMGQLGTVEIAMFMGKINGYQAALQGSYSGFIAFSSQVKSFVRTYKSTQESLEKSLSLQERERDIQYKTLMSGELSASVGYEKTLLNTQNSVEGLKSQIDVAKNGLDNLKKSYDVTLQSLQNAIKEAQIAYASAEKEFSKLTLRSPINGTMSEVFLDVGQEVSPGIKVANILSDKTPEIQIALSDSERFGIKEGQEVYVDIGVERVTGKIYAISEIADANLNYPATIVFQSGTNILGSIVTVKIPVQSEKKLMPLNIMKTQGSGKASINIYSGTGFLQANLELGEIFGEMAEILSCRLEQQNCEGQKIVLGDISNYDPIKFTLKEQTTVGKK